jgi:hypothetical protein
MNETDETTRELLGWALLFSVPVGVGVSMASMRMSRGALSDPIVVLPGVVAAAAVFALVVAVGRDGTAAA